MSGKCIKGTHAVLRGFFKVPGCQSLASFLLMSSYKDIENLVKGCPGIKFKSNREFGPLFWSVQGGATNCIHMHKTSHAHTHTHTQTRTHARTEERMYTHTHTHTHTRLHYFDRSLSPSLRHPRSFQGTIHVPPWYLFYLLRNPFLYLSDTLKQGALKDVR